MKSALPKVLMPVCGEPMINFPLRLAADLSAQPQVAVVGHKAELVQKSVQKEFGEAVGFQLQAQQNGTGHAVMEGMKGLEGFSGRVLILSGDVPLLQLSTLQSMLAHMDQKSLSVVFLSAILDDATGYGRVVRNAEGQVERIVEHKDASEAEREIREINAGIYCVEADFLREALGQLKSDNAQGEYYLTDIIDIALKSHKALDALPVSEAEEVQGANNRAQLAELDSLLRKRICEGHLANGVGIIDPNNVYIGPQVQIGADTTIYPGVHLRGKTKIASGCTIDVGCVLTDAILHEGAKLHPYSMMEEAEMQQDANLGPYGRLRPGALLEEGSRVGNFVELKKTRLGKGAKANHLAYLGDSTIGPKANVGAGTITCNYDGYGKHKTEIGEGVFVGSNSTLVAPLQIGQGAYVAAGSVLTDAVGQDDLAFGRARQLNKEGRAKAVREVAENSAKKAKGK